MFNGFVPPNYTGKTFFLGRHKSVTYIVVLLSIKNIIFIYIYLKKY